MVHLAGSAPKYGHRDGTQAGSPTSSRRSSLDTTDIEAQRVPVTTDNLTKPRVQILDPVHDSEKDGPQSTQTPNRTPTTMSRSTTKSLRHRGRAQTSNLYSGVEMGRTSGWAPGQEPGIDTSDPAPPYSQGNSLGHDAANPYKLDQQCEILVVDYTQDEISQYNLDNDNLEEFLQQPPEDLSTVRWINVNGLSWDVIRSLGNYKRLHRLAIEDIMNTRNRTKVDWYNDHTLMLLSLQKLTNLQDSMSDDDSDGDDDDDSLKEGVSMNAQTKYERERRTAAKRHRRSRRGALVTLLHDLVKPKRKTRANGHHVKSKGSSLSRNPSGRSPWARRTPRSLQRFHASPNQDRTDFMERHATLARKGLTVTMEQVSIFLTADNTVISFFETAAQDIEIPILRRLQSPETILRQCCDASMLAQAIIDAIIDLAIPVTSAYADAVGDLELDVLTDPDIRQSTALYILTSEIAVLRNAIAPVSALISALKDHKSSAPAASGAAVSSRTTTPTPERVNTNNNTARPAPPRKASTFSSGVSISPLTVTYLGDVEDHVVLISDAYDQARRSADNLVDLIFNTIGATQNESMKQLSIVTCVFLPLSFLTGYFGMNFATFPGAHEHSDKFFWVIAMPVSVVVMILLMRDVLIRAVVKWANRILIKRGRKRRLETY